MTDLNATWDEALRGPRMSESTGKVIFKYQMPVKEQFHVELPRGAQIIRVADLDGMFWLWAIVDTNAPMEKRYFRAFKTGAKIPDNFDTSHYLGMCAVFIQMELGLYIFEDTERWNEDEDDRVQGDLARTYPSMDSWKKVTEFLNQPGRKVRTLHSDPGGFFDTVWPNDLINARRQERGRAREQNEETDPILARFQTHTLKDWPIDGPTYRETIQGVNAILDTFKDVINYKGKPTGMNQTQLDIEESRMEDDDD